MCILLENSVKMWPMYVDYSDEECRRVLRSLELEAYANIVNAFRAQGSLSKERRKLLQDLCSILGISMERHRAEIRRAVNDEHLNTIAERLCGPNTSTDWAIEGRRVVPLMPRLAPQTVFTAVADSAASAQAAKNASLPLPGKTGVREISNGIETMASRKRKELPPDSTASPSKMSIIDSQYFNNFCSFDSTNSSIPEHANTPSGSTTSTESCSPPDSTSQISPFSDQTPLKATSSILTGSVSPVKPLPKQIMLKSSSASSTYSSFDQVNTTLLSSRPAPSHSPSPTTIHEEQILTIPEVSKISTEAKNSQRISPSISSMKTSTILSTSATSSSTPTTSDRISLSSSTSSSIGNKFLTQIRCKSTSHGRQNLPSSLGLKLNSQSQITQKGLSPKSSPSLKVKQENPSSFFTKKVSQTVFSSASSTDNPSQFLSSSSESSTVTKSPISVSKTTVKTESSVVSSSQSNNKITTVTKSFPKTSTPTSQYMARSLFSTTTKAGAKTLPPVIFNVSSTTCTPLQTAAKTTVSVQSDATKTTPQLLPKSTSVGIAPSHLKINASNSQTIQYRNDGGVMRSARIVNISQPVGSRLPCAITPSAISALGLASNLTSTALRVTLPAGTLNTSASMRVSAAAKPNVIVVHKAQMWPRTQQGAAVIMSSAAPIPKLPNDISETVSIAQKQEKSRLSGAKLAARPVSVAQPQSPSAVTATTIKIPETTSLLTTPLSKNSSSDNGVSSDNSKLQESLSENQCKKNLLADVIEASGILESASDKAASKDKNKESKEEKKQSLLVESESKPKKTNIASSAVDGAPTASPELSITKVEITKTTEPESTSTTSSEPDKNGVSSKLFEVPDEQKDICEPTVTSSQTNENLSSTSESSTTQADVSKDKSL